MRGLLSAATATTEAFSTPSPRQPKSRFLFSLADDRLPPGRPLPARLKHRSICSDDRSHDAAVNAQRRTVGGGSLSRADIDDHVRHLFHGGEALQQ